MGALNGGTIGTVGGVLIGAEVGLGIPEYEAKRYEGKVKEGVSLSRWRALAWRFGSLRSHTVKESKGITLSSSDSTTTEADFTYSMKGKVISITYLGPSSIGEEIGRILRRIEHGHQGPVTSYRLLYQVTGWAENSGGTTIPFLGLVLVFSARISDDRLVDPRQA
jgi:hypothetical protein